MFDVTPDDQEAVALPEVVRMETGVDPSTVLRQIASTPRSSPITIDLCGKTVLMQPDDDGVADLFVVQGGITIRNGGLKLSRLVVRRPPRKSREPSCSSRRGSFTLPGGLVMEAASNTSSRPDSPSKGNSPMTSPHGSRAQSFTLGQPAAGADGPRLSGVGAARRRSSALLLSAIGGPGLRLEDVMVMGRVHIEGGRMDMKNCQGWGGAARCGGVWGQAEILGGKKCLLYNWTLDAN